MKKIFGENIFKYGVESFFVMYMNQYQLVLGSDLEDYAKSQELFNDQNPCNIYFILKRPKVTIDPKSIKIKEKKATLDFIIHNRGEQERSKINFEFKKAKSELKFHTEYPYNLFVFAENDEPLLIARPSSLIDNNILQGSIDTEILDYEVLYIGQSYGKDGKRTALDRLLSHKTLQKIYGETLAQNPDSDIWIMLTNFSQVSMLVAAGSELINVKEEDTEVENKKMEHMFENNGIKFTENQKINFTEGALIKYFEPKYNLDFKNSFPTAKHKSYSECYDLDVRVIGIEIDTSEMARRIFTNKTGKKDWHFENFEFENRTDRFNLLNLPI